MLRSNNNKMFFIQKNLGKLLHVNRTMHLKNNKRKINYISEILST